MELWLLDTGPIVAFLDSQEPDHKQVATAFDAFTGRFVTTSPVVVEAMHFLSSAPSGAAILVDFLLTSQTEIHPCMSSEDLAKSVELMDKYSDTPMDFADSTLVLLATRLKIHAVCTLDRRGFRTYRIGRRAFRLVLDE